MNNANKNSELLQRIATYSAVAGASIAGSAPALAAAVSVDAGVNGTYTSDSGCENTNLDVDGDSNNDFQLEICDSDGNSSIRFYSQSAPNGGPNQMAQATCDNDNGADYGAVNVAPGTSISATTGDWDYYAALFWYENASAECNSFAQGEPGILPFRLCDSDGSYGCTGYRYGYLNVSWDRGSTILNILGGQYETTANASITARANGAVAVPVGGAVPLGIGLLALGAAALRRRRKHGDH